MGKSPDNSRYGRISREIHRLEKNLRNVPEDKRRLTKGLVERAAFLRIELEDLEADINANGSTELYYPSPDAEPITRARAAAQLYEKLVRQYTAVCKQLADLATPSAAPAGKNAGGGAGSKKQEPTAFEDLLERRMRRVK